MKNIVVSSALVAALSLGGCVMRRSQSSSSTGTTSSTAAGSTAGTSAPQSAGTADRTQSTPATTSGAVSSSATAAGEATTLTGCLSQGAGASSYELADETTGVKTPVRGTADLAKHVGHKVTLTGNKAGNAEFNASSIQHLAASCQSGATR